MKASRERNFFSALYLAIVISGDRCAFKFLLLDIPV
jgi:hypothetical protein